jgi:hypothetical protein
MGEESTKQGGDIVAAVLGILLTGICWIGFPVLFSGIQDSAETIRPREMPPHYRTVLELCHAALPNLAKIEKEFAAL